MINKERRKYIRINSLNLLDISVVENQIVVNQGIGRTLNVSESGILLETHFSVDLTSSLLLTIAIENDLITINGKVAYCKLGKNEMYETGVQFLDMDESAMQVIGKLVKSFKIHNISNS